MMKYSNAAVATARRRQGPARLQPETGSAGSPTASGPAATPELMWLSLAASTKAWADRLCGDERVVTRQRAVGYLRQARAAALRAGKMGDGRSKMEGGAR